MQFFEGTCRKFIEPFFFLNGPFSQLLLSNAGKGSKFLRFGRGSFLSFPVFPALGRGEPLFLGILRRWEVASGGVPIHIVIGMIFKDNYGGKGDDCRVSDSLHLGIQISFPPLKMASEAWVFKIVYIL